MTNDLLITATKLEIADLMRAIKECNDPDQMTRLVAALKFAEENLRELQEEERKI